MALRVLAAPASAGSARDYLSGPIDTWFTAYNFGYFASVTPEDGIDLTSTIRSNVLSQSVVFTRVMDYWGRTGGMSVILPYRSLYSASDAFRAANAGISDVGLFARGSTLSRISPVRSTFRSASPPGPAE